MEDSETQFTTWLSKTLTVINSDADVDVFVSYISGILETETDTAEIKESISGILSEITLCPDIWVKRTKPELKSSAITKNRIDENDSESVCNAVLSKWNELHQRTENNSKSDLAIEKQLSEMLEKQKIKAVPTRQLTEEEKARKAAILAQYAQVSDGEGSDEDGEADGENGASAASNTDSALMRNVNAELVTKVEKDKREASRLEAERKKQKDKEDREKQKQKQQERKDAEKKRTQKGEKRR